MNDAGHKSVKQLESYLFSLFPRAWAEPWDKVGLLVGDPNARVEAVAFALDATPLTVRQAKEHGANVLVTHHPVCLEMPRSISPQSSGAPQSSSCIWEAVSTGVAVISMHTNLDRSTHATAALPSMLGLAPKCGIELGREEHEGRLGSYAPHEGTLGDLARSCLGVFGQCSQVYGDLEAPVNRVAFFTGSLGDSAKEALACNADAIVCGECGYHRAIEATGRSCGVIILGHDVSELPLVGVLRDCVADKFIEASRCVMLDQPPAWHDTRSL